MIKEILIVAVLVCVFLTIGAFVENQHQIIEYLLNK